MKICTRFILRASASIFCVARTFSCIASLRMRRHSFTLVNTVKLVLNDDPATVNVAKCFW